MPYIIRSANGLIITEKDKELIFHSKQKAFTYLSILQNSTNDEWSIVFLEDKDSKGIKKLN